MARTSNNNTGRGALPRRGRGGRGTRKRVGGRVTFGGNDTAGGVVVETSSTARARVTPSTRGSRHRVSADLAEQEEENVPVTPASVWTSNSSAAGSIRPRRKGSAHVSGSYALVARGSPQSTSTPTTAFRTAGLDTLAAAAINVQVPASSNDTENESAENKESDNDDVEGGHHEQEADNSKDDGVKATGATSAGSSSCPMPRGAKKPSGAIARACEVSFRGEAKLAIMKILHGLGSDLLMPSFTGQTKNVWHNWHERVGIPCQQYLRRIPSYMRSDRASLVDTLFSLDNMRYLKSWVVSQMSQEKNYQRNKKKRSRAAAEETLDPFKKWRARVFMDRHDLSARNAHEVGGSEARAVPADRPGEAAKAVEARRGASTPLGEEGNTRGASSPSTGGRGRGGRGPRGERGGRGVGGEASVSTSAAATGQGSRRGVGYAGLSTADGLSSGAGKAYKGKGKGRAQTRSSGFGDEDDERDTLVSDDDIMIDGVSSPGPGSSALVDDPSHEFVEESDAEEDMCAEQFPVKATKKRPRRQERVGPGLLMSGIIERHNSRMKVERERNNSFTRLLNIIAGGDDKKTTLSVDETNFQQETARRRMKIEEARAEAEIQGIQLKNMQTYVSLVRSGVDKAFIEQFMNTTFPDVADPGLGDEEK